MNVDLQVIRDLRKEIELRGMQDLTIVFDYAGASRRDELIRALKHCEYLLEIAASTECKTK